MASSEPRGTEELVAMSCLESAIHEGAAAIEALTIIAQGDGDAQTIAQQTLTRLGLSWEPVDDQ